MWCCGIVLHAMLLYAACAIRGFKGLEGDGPYLCICFAKLINYDKLPCWAEGFLCNQSLDQDCLL